MVTKDSAIRLQNLFQFLTTSVSLKLILKINALQHEKISTLIFYCITALLIRTPVIEIAYTEQVVVVAKCSAEVQFLEYECL